MTRTTRRARTAVALALVTIPLTAAAAAAMPPPPCLPSVDGNGPSVHIAPDYADPTRSDVYYESNGIWVEVDLCLG